MSLGIKFLFDQAGSLPKTSFQITPRDEHPCRWLDASRC